MNRQATSSERNGTTPDELLQHMIRLAGTALPEPGPHPEPRPGNDPIAWATQTAVRRARHDDCALEGLELLNRFLRAEFGEDPFGLDDADLITSWESVPVSGGTIGVQIHRPPSGRLPVIALVHGGAFWLGGGAACWRLNADLCRVLATRIGCVVISIDHRLAPEHPYPVPLDDVATAIRWIVDNADRLNVDPRRLGLYGISSGGALVSSCAHMALDGELPAVRAVALQCPSINLSLDSARFTAPPEAVAGARRIIAMYCRDADPADPRISPALRGEVDGLPPHHIVTARLDPLTADAMAYADKLTAAGVDVTSRTLPMTHTVATPRVLRSMYEDTAAWLADHL